MSELSNLSQLLVSLGHPPVAFEQLVKFIAFASRLKNNILLAQPATFDPASDTLPIQFHSEACLISLLSINIIWGVLAQTAWNTNLNISPISGGSLSDYEKFGHH